MTPPTRRRCHAEPRCRIPLLDQPLRGAGREHLALCGSERGHGPRLPSWKCGTVVTPDRSQWRSRTVRQVASGGKSCRCGDLFGAQRGEPQQHHPVHRHSPRKRTPDPRGDHHRDVGAAQRHLPNPVGERNVLAAARPGAIARHSPRLPALLWHHRCHPQPRPVVAIQPAGALAGAG